MLSPLWVGVIVTLAFLCFSFIIPSHNTTVHAATGINHQINFQGKLVNTDGTNVTDGTYTVVFSIYNVASAGANLWTESQSVVVSNGIFQVNLGSVTTLPASVDFNTDNIYLGIKVGSDAEMTPRIQFTAVPQAFNSEKLNGLASSAFAQLAATPQTFTGTNIFKPSTNITSVQIVQNTSGSFGQDVFNVQGSSGGANNFIQVTSTAANQGAVTIASLGANNLNLNSGSNIISVGATSVVGTGALTVAAAAGQSLDLESGSTANLNIGISGNNKTVNIGAVGSTANTTTLNLATSTGAAQTVNIGSTNTSSPITLTSGGTKQTLTNTGNVMQTTTNSTTAFQVQNTSAATILNIDTSTTSNLITNGDFEGGGTNGWTAKGASTLSQVTTNQWQGNNSLSVATTTAANDGAKYAYTLTASTQYTLSFYAKVGSSTITDFVAGRQDVSGTDVTCLTAQTLTTTWQRFNCTFTTGATITSSNIFFQKSGATAETLYIDGVQLQTGASATAFNAGGALQVGGLVNSPISFQNKQDSATAFQIQNAAGTSNLLLADTTNSRIGINRAAAAASLEVASSGSNDILDLYNGSTLRTQLNSLGNQQWWVNSGSGEVGTIFYSTPNGFPGIGLENASGTGRTDIRQLGTTGGLVIGATSGSGIPSAQFTLSNTGAITLRNSTDSTTAFQIQNAAGTNNLFVVDTTSNGALTLGANASSLTTVNGMLTTPNSINANGGITTSTASTDLSLNATGVNININAKNLTGVGNITGNAAITLGASGAGNGLTVKNAVNSTTAFQVQNAAGTSNLFNADTTNNRIGIGTNSPNTLFEIVMQNAGDGLRLTGSTTGPKNPALQLYDAANDRGALALAEATGYYSSSASAGDIVLRATTGSLILQTGTAAAQLKIAQGGATTLQNTTDSTTAFQIQNAAGTSNLLVADTTNSAIGIGTASTNNSAQLFVGTNSSSAIQFGTDTSLYRFSASTLRTQSLQANDLTLIYGNLNSTNSTSNLFNTYTTTINFGGAATAINIGASTGTTTINNGLTVNGIGLFKNSTNSTTAFQVQNAAGNNNLLLANTINPNLIVNSSAETDGSGWVINTGSGSAPVSSSTYALYGNSSLAINTSAAANAGAKYDTATLLSTTTTYSLSFWAKIGAGSFTVQAGRADNDTFAGESTCSLNATTVNTTWQRFTCSFTTATVTTGGYIFIRQSDSTSRTWYVDGIQLEQAAAPTNYREGSLQFNGTITGPTIFQNASDTTQAFQIQNAAGTSTVLNVDTSTGKGQVGIGTAAPSRTLDLAVNNSNNTALPLLVEQAGSGDTGLEFKTPAKSFYTGLDGDNGGKYVISSSAATGNTNTFGNLATGGTIDNSNNGQYICTKFTASATGTVTSITVNFANIDGVNNSAQAAIYSDSAGAVGTKMATSASQTLTTGQNTFALSQGVSSGTVYWLCTDSNTASTTNNNVVFDNGAANQTKATTTGFAFGSWPTSMPNASSTSASQNEMFANLNISSSFDSLGTPLFSLGDTGQAIFQNFSNSTTAFQIQNAAGTSILNADTTNSIVAVRGINSNATIGSELMLSTTNFSSNWSGLHWTFNGTSAVHTAGAGFTAPAVYTGFTPVAGKTYQVTFTFSGASGNGTDSITPFIGGQTGSPIYDASYTSETQIIGATGTGSLQFTPTANWNGTITSVSVKLVTTSTNPVVSVSNSDGTTGLEVRAGGSGLNNTFIGVQAGLNTTTGNGNVSLGNVALQKNTSGSLNTAIGLNALQDNTVGTENTAIGNQALVNNIDGTQNTAVGSIALQNNVTGYGNNAFGVGSLENNTSGYDNSGIGASAFQNNTTGYFNIGVGGGAGFNNTTGRLNTTVGVFSLYHNTTGIYNTAVGESALNASNGNYNTGVGQSALTSNTSGAFNVALGLEAGYTNTITNANTTGSNNTFIGADAGPGVASAVSLQNATAIGVNSIVNANDTLTLGCISGINGCGTSTKVGIASGGYANNALTVAAGTSSAGTISQTASTAIVGTTTAFASGMVGGTIYYSDGTSDTIATFTDATHITTTGSHTESGTYTIVWGGVNVTSTGAVSLQNTANSTAAFKIQNALSTTTLFNADTTNSIITIAGNTTTFASLTLTNAHFKVTQTTVPTIGTPGTCGTTPSAALAASAADSAGSFRITSGTGAQGICTAVITFNKAYGAAPKSIIVVPETQDGGTGTAAARQIYVSAANTSTFTVKYTSAPAGVSEVDWFYYWVVE